MNINEILDQIERGLEGVTPGPWKPHRNNAFWELVPNNAGTNGIPYSIADFCASDPSDTRGLQEANAAHIARCDPGTMRAIIDAYRQMEARAEAAEAECKRLESSRDGYARKSDAHEKIAGEWQSRAEAAEAKVARMREALEPFATFGKENTDEGGWAGLMRDRDRIFVWFGPSDFRTALKAMENTDD
ncbi:hypothetical protein ACLB6G_20535 [Zhengella sp. ZM62]|uniref:hypothetical protein n=1 Tax=Zhengella sedimenti TaxID=3390035 RepID=UPI003975930E